MTTMTFGTYLAIMIGLVTDVVIRMHKNPLHNSKLHILT